MCNDPVGVVAEDVFPVRGKRNGPVERRRKVQGEEGPDARRAECV